MKQSVQAQIKAQLKVAAYAGEEAYKQEEIVNAGNSNSNEEIPSVIDAKYDNGGVIYLFLKVMKELLQQSKMKKVIVL